MYAELIRDGKYKKYWIKSQYDNNLGIALAIGLSRFVVNWVTSLGN